MFAMLIGVECELQSGGGGFVGAPTSPIGACARWTTWISTPRSGHRRSDDHVLAGSIPFTGSSELRLFAVPTAPVPRTALALVWDSSESRMSKQGSRNGSRNNTPVEPVSVRR